MKRRGIKQKIFIAIILISLIGYTATVSAQGQSLQPFLYSYYYTPSDFGLSIFGSILYPWLNGGCLSYPSSLVPSLINPPRTSSNYPTFSSPYWTPSYSVSPQLLNTSLLRPGFPAFSYESPSINTPLVETPVYASPKLYVSPYLPGNRIVWPLTTTYLRTNLWACPTTSHAEKDLDQQWDKILEAIENLLPGKVIEHLKGFIPLALEKERYDLAMKAICKQLLLEVDTQGDESNENGISLEEGIENAPDLLKPLLKFLLAQEYWQYYQENRQCFSQRDATADIDEADFATWDLHRLFEKIDELYTEALSLEEYLKFISMEMFIEMFTDFFEEGSIPISYCPTLFDFASFSAISFYRDGDQPGNAPEDAFELDADSDAFAPAEDFINYSPETTDISSPLLKAIKLYQRVLDFHINDTSKEAFVEADISRLIFIKDLSSGEERSNHYMRRLSEIAEGYPFMPLSSLAYYYWAQELYDQDNYAEALKIAKKGKAQHADSDGAKMCQTLIARIEAKEMTLKGLFSINPLCIEIRLDYRNIAGINLQVVEDQWDYFLEESYGLPDYISNDKFQQLIKKRPMESWSVALEPAIDYKTRSHTIKLPCLKPGYYRLIASWQQDFAEQENATRVVSFWLTGITMVTERINGETIGFILDAHSGAPLEGAEVTGFLQDSDGYYREVGVICTDEYGSFTIPDDYQRFGVLHVKYEGYELVDTVPVSAQDQELKTSLNPSYSHSSLPPSTMPTNISAPNIYVSQPSLPAMPTDINAPNISSRPLLPLPDMPDEIYLPVCPPPDSNGVIELYESCTLPSGAHFYDRKYVFKDSNITLYCRDATLQSDKLDTAITMYASDGAEQITNITVMDCNIIGYKNGIVVPSGLGPLTKQIIVEPYLSLYHDPVERELQVAELEDLLRQMSINHITFERVNIRDSDNVGLYISAWVKNVTFDHGSVSGCGGPGIYLDAGSRYNTISNSKIFENGREGIAIDASAFNKIYKNHFYKNNKGKREKGGIFLYKNSWENKVGHCPRNQHARGNRIWGNRFEDEDVGVWIASRQSNYHPPGRRLDPVAYRKVWRFNIGLNNIEIVRLYYRDYAEDTEVFNNRFINVDKGVIVYDDGAHIMDNRFLDVNKGIIVGNKVRKWVGDPVHDTLVHGNKFCSRTLTPFVAEHCAVNILFEENVRMTTSGDEPLEGVPVSCDCDRDVLWTHNANGDGFDYQSIYQRVGVKMSGERRIVGDFDGDGRDDTAKVYETNDGQTRLWLQFSDGNEFTHRSNFLTFDESSSSKRWLAGDVNGDGCDDLIVVFGDDEDRAWVRTHFSTSNNHDDQIVMFGDDKARALVKPRFSTRRGFELQSSLQRFAGYWDKQRWLVGDFNGDGYDDLVNVYGNNGTARAWVHHSTGVGFEYMSSFDIFDDFWDRQYWLVGNFNGDRYDDLVNVYGNIDEAYARVYISTGDGFVYMSSFDTTFTGFWDWDKQRWLVGNFKDFNGDHCDDLVNIFGLNGTAYAWVHLSTGDGFEYMSSFDTFAGFWDKQQWLLGDFDGNGYDDLLNAYNGAW